MNHITVSNWMRGRAMAAVACAALAAPMMGCGSGGGSASNSSGANLPPLDASQGGAMNRAPQTAMTPAPRQGMSTKKKVVLLVGAAALYYLYKKHQANSAASASASQQGQGVYYLSKNGRVYYRDQTGRAVYVTPPPQGIEVPAEEAQLYQGLQGYDRSQSGTTDLSRFASQNGGM